MILTCNYEEVTALAYGARAFLRSSEIGPGQVAAPARGRDEVEELLPHLTGDLSFETLAEQRHAERAVRAVAEHLAERMREVLEATHPAAEEAVAAYFDWAHTHSVLTRLEELGGEMQAMLEVVTGRQADGQILHTFQFPD